jgi:hypothetical protein
LYDASQSQSFVMGVFDEIKTPGINRVSGVREPLFHFTQLFFLRA